MCLSRQLVAIESCVGVLVSFEDNKNLLDVVPVIFLILRDRDGLWGRKQAPIGRIVCRVLGGASVINRPVGWGELDYVPHHIFLFGRAVYREDIPSIELGRARSGVHVPFDDPIIVIVLGDRGWVWRFFRPPERDSSP